MKQALALQQNSDLLALQRLQLHDIQQNISHGNALASLQLTDSSGDGREIYAARVTHRRRSHRRTFCLPLPRWLTNRTWMFAVSQSQQSWTMEIHPVNRRPWESPAFDCIRVGDLAALQKALDTGELSTSDVVHNSRSNSEFTLLGVCSCCKIRDRILTSLQLAILYQHFELCRYLVDAVEHFQQSDKLLKAAEALIAAVHPLQYKIDVVELFAGKYDMDVDITSSSTEVPSLVQFEFPSISRVVMSHQPFALEKITLSDRFDIAMRFTQETPVEFLDTVGLAVGRQLTSLKDARGATVLHWAARRWAMLEDAQPSERTEHADFVLELIKAGALVSAVNECGQSPLMCIFGGPPYRFDAWPWVSHYHDYPVLVSLVKSWGSTLAGAGVSLQEYIKAENSALRARKREDDTVTFLRNCALKITGLYIATNGSLAIEARSVGSITVYARTTPPGSFVQEDEIIPTLSVGSPLDDGEIWHQISYRELVSESTILHPEEDSFVQAEFDIDKTLFKSPQDDHGTITAIFRRNENRLKRERRGITSKWRSASTPPATRTLAQYRTPALQIGLVRDSQTGLPYESEIYVHKCPFDLQWGFISTKFFQYDHEMWGVCMKGCRGRPDHTADIRNHLTSKQPLIA